MTEEKPSQLAPDQDHDRRRNPRFGCAGAARIICLPSDGILVPGQIRDLSLGGCKVQTADRLECGALVEILARVNALSFRAVGRVRMVRGQTAAGLQFLQLSSGGQSTLLELVRELARQHAIAQMVRAARSGPPPSLLLEGRTALLRAGTAERIVMQMETAASDADAEGPSLLVFDSDLDLYI